MDDYIKTLMPERTGILLRMETAARANHIPIIDPEVTALLEVLIKTAHIKSILEVGTAIGYSSLLFCMAAGPDSRIITIERNLQHVATARGYISEAGLTDNIKVMPGDALEVLPNLTEPVDMVFLDGAKGHYLEMMELCLPLLKPGGLLISDNILFHGMVSGEEKVPHRRKTIVTRMRDYLDTITTHPQLKTSILTISDGLAVSCKLEESK